MSRRTVHASARTSTTRCIAITAAALVFASAAMEACGRNLDQESADASPGGDGSLTPDSAGDRDSSNTRDVRGSDEDGFDEDLDAGADAIDVSTDAVSADTGDDGSSAGDGAGDGGNGDDAGDGGPTSDGGDGGSPGAVLVSTADSFTQTINIVTTSGIVLGTFTVEPADGGDGALRGRAVDVNGNVQIYDGTFNPFLATLDTTNGTVTYHAGPPDWSTVNDVTYGGLAVTANAVFATDMSTAYGTPNGIVRFDIDAGYAATRFGSTPDGAIGGPGGDYIDVTLGLDGLLYGRTSSDIGNGTVDVYDPATNLFQRTITLLEGDAGQVDTRAIAVDQNGNLFAVGFDSTLVEFDPTGGQMNSLTMTGVSRCASIDIDSAGHVVAGCDKLVFTETTLATATYVDACNSIWGCFVAWTKR